MLQIRLLLLGCTNQHFGEHRELLELACFLRDVFNVLHREFSMPNVSSQLLLDVDDQLLRGGVEGTNLDDGNREEVIDLGRMVSGVGLTP